MGIKLQRAIKKLILKHNRTEKDRVVSLIVLLVNRDENGEYTWDSLVDEGETPEDNRRLVSALCHLSVKDYRAFRAIMNAATVMQDKNQFTIHRFKKEDLS